MRHIVLVLLVSLLPCFAWAQAASPLVAAQLIGSAERITPGEAFDVELELSIPDGWHTYADPPGDAGLPTSITWKLPEGFTAGPIRWPTSQMLKEGDLTVNAYTGIVRLPVRITPPSSLAQELYTLKADVTWLVCSTICIPETAILSLDLPATPGGRASSNPIAHAPSTTLFAAIVLALLGGLILNLMPCVFPVLSLKCLAVARQGKLKPAEARAEGIAYTTGILVCFTLIAGALLALKSGGEVIGWGYQMQSPTFVAALALLLFVIGLNLSGLFTLPVLLGSTGTDLTREPTIRGSFATGVLATLVATPCTAPFMATAIGYALTQPPFAALLVFEALGLGLAAPFLFISFFPRILKFLPKPGAWMESFRQFLAFPMYLSAVWLIWVLSQQAGPQSVAITLSAMTLIAFVFWTKRLIRPVGQLYHILAPLMVLIIGTAALTSVHHLRNMMDGVSVLLHGGEPYSATRLNELRREGKPVFVDATAAWCITCQLNYHSTLATDTVQNAFKAKNITFMVADWTNADPEITEFLSSFGYKGVPLYVYFPAHGEPRVLPQLLTPSIVLETIE